MKSHCQLLEWISIAYNNNTLPDTGISSNKIYKSKEDSYGKVKGKGVMFFNWP
jgi:hypothetical protein